MKITNPKIYVKNKLPQHAIMKQGKVIGGGFRKNENLKENKSDLINKNIIECPNGIDHSILNFFGTVKALEQQDRNDDLKNHIDVNSDLKQVDKYIGKGIDSEEDFYSANDVFFDDQYQNKAIKRDDVIFNLDRYEAKDSIDTQFPPSQYSSQKNTMNLRYVKKPSVKILTSAILSISRKY